MTDKCKTCGIEVDRENGYFFHGRKKDGYPELWKCYNCIIKHHDEIYPKDKQELTFAIKTMGLRFGIMAYFTGGGFRKVLDK